MSLPEDRASTIRASFARQSLMRTFGAELDALGEGHAVITAPILPIALQQQGFGHAGLTFALGDTAAGYAAVTAMPEGFDVLTVEMKVNLLAPAAGDRLRATGTVIRMGRRLGVVTARVEARRDGAWRDVALLQGTMMPVPPPAD